MKVGEEMPLGLSLPEAEAWVEAGGCKAAMAAALEARDGLGRCVTIDANILLVLAGFAAVAADRRAPACGEA